MNKAIEVMGVLQDLGLIVDNMPGIKISTYTQVDYSMINIKYNENEVVIFDLKSAVGEGMKELHNVKNSFKAPFVIVITNLYNDDFKQRCFSLGADKFFNKNDEIKEFGIVLNNQLYKLSNNKFDHARFV